MLNRQIADNIHQKVSSLVGQPLSIVGIDGIVLSPAPSASPNPIPEHQLDNAIKFEYSGKLAGYVLPEQPLPNLPQVAPLIQSIAELILQQSVMLDQIPLKEERVDKFLYDLLHQNQLGDETAQSEAKLFGIDIAQPRIVIVLQIDDPALTSQWRDPSSDREDLIMRYRQSVARSLRSFYTQSSDNIVAYLGQNNYCVLKDLYTSPSHELQESLDSFKKTINAVYDIIKAGIKPPVTVGIGNYHPGTAGLRKSYKEALSAIELGLQAWEKGRVYHIDDFGVVAPLLSGVDEDNIYFSKELLEKLGENTEIIQTIETFLNMDMNLTRSAESLGIHRNTLVYRLDRIADLLGLDPRVFEDAVQIKLAILYGKFVEQS